jgi:phosphatidylserine/phosphatidylglycerophosphate/cardiolipin synthase-like enzyme
MVKTQNPVRSSFSVLLAVVIIIAAVLISVPGVIRPLAPAAVVPDLPISGEAAAAPGNVTAISIPQGFGAQKGFWQVFFTAPTGSSDRSRYVGGIDTQLAAAINGVQRTLDIAAFEFNDPLLTQAVLDAKQRGIRVRMVTDDTGGLGEANSTVSQLISAGIPVVDDERNALMHDKFMILDSTVVWTGSWNYTINDTFRNNNNALALRTQLAVQDYQAEFNEMFEQKRFGGGSPSDTPNASFTQNGTPIQVYFGSEDQVVPAILSTVNAAQHTLHFMAFSFTLDDVGKAIEARAAAGVQVQGIFEKTGSQTEFSELRPLLCAGLNTRQDGNRYVLHHKVFIIDGTTVIAGSFNFTTSARDANDENMLIIQDADLAAQYEAEFARRWAEAQTPSGLC